MPKKFKFVIAAILLIIGLWSVAWGYGAYQINRAFVALAANDAASDIDCGRFSVTGFPFRYDIYCGAGVIIQGDNRLEFAAFKGTVRIYSLFHMVGFVDGPVKWQNNFTGSQRELSFSKARASVRLDQQFELRRASLVSTNIAWADTLAGRFELANAAKLEAHIMAMPDQDRGLNGYVRIDDASLIQTGIFEGDVTLDGALSEFDRNVANWRDPSTLRRWQTSGGRLTIAQLDIKTHTLSLAATGALGLDEYGLLNGVVTTTSTGPVGQFAPDTFGLLSGATPDTASGDGAYILHWRANAGQISMNGIPLFALPGLFDKL